jgi:hypothetical protein
MFVAFGGSGLFDGGGFLDGGVPSDGGAGIASDPGAIAFVLLGLFISHGISYRLNYIGRGEYLRTSVVRQMAAPYGRLVVLHITIILGGMAIAFTKRRPRPSCWCCSERRSISGSTSPSTGRRR